MKISHPTQEAETEVTPRVRRRSFTKEYKLDILEQADRRQSTGDIGRLLRQEGLYSSHLSVWRAQRRAGTLVALGRKRGPKRPKSDEQQEVERLRLDNARLRRKLAHAEKIIDVQKKLSEVLGITLDDGDPKGEDD
jgi:transposase-like protein